MVLQLEETEKGLAVILPEEVVQGSQLSAGSSIDLTVNGDTVQIARVRRSKYTTEELLAGVTDDNIHPETDWGLPVGKEAW